MFVDRIRVKAKAGDGGDGCVSFRREKFVPRGGPDGGDGGRGGDILLRADVHTDNLVDYFYQPLLRSDRGEHGLGKNMYGRAGKPSIHKVPVGTKVYRVLNPPGEAPRAADLEAGSGEVPVEPALILEPVADLVVKDQDHVLCRGGNGGRGNVHFKSSRNRVPRQYTEGEAGEEGTFLFELQTIADAGLVGYPNAGKSTVLGQISAAHPKVAPYPFTTLNPIVGVVEYPDYQRLTVADIPGLIEGAHRNVGLGHDFLRHIVRCKFLIFVLDVAGSEGREPIADLGSLRRELDLYDPNLSERPWLIVANKIDLPGAGEQLERLRGRFPGRLIIAMAASERTGVVELKNALREMKNLQKAMDQAVSEGAESSEASRADVTSG